MIFQKIPFPGVRARSTALRRDSAVAPILLVLLGLVFAPVIGLHFALAASSTPAPHQDVIDLPAPKRTLG